MTTATNGVDRCPCGSSWWAKRIVGRKLCTTCVACNKRFDPAYSAPQPTDVALDADFIDAVEDVLIFRFDIDAGTATAIARAIVEELEP